MGRHRLWAGGTQGSETSQYLQEGILREWWRAKADQTKPVARDTRRGLRCRCRGITCPGSDGPGGSHKTACQGNRLEGLAVEGASPVPGREPSSDRVVPSSAGLVESRVNQPRPLGKSKHTCLTDSVPVP